MEILFVCRFFPHADVRDSGGQDVYHYISALSERHSVSLIAFVTAGQDTAVESMRAICNRVIAVPYSRDAMASRLWRAGWRLLLPRVYGRVVSIPFWKSLRETVSRTHYDMVIIDGMMAPYGRLVKGPRKLLDEIDIYAMVAYHEYQNAQGFLTRTWLLLDWLRTQAYELRYARSYDMVLVRSERDRTVLSSYLPGSGVQVLSPWFEGLAELRAVAARRPRGNRLLFVGAMNLPANVEAVSYFVRRVLPLVRSAVPDAEFHIVGSAPTLSVQQLAAEEGVVVAGEVADLTPYFEACAVNVVPLLTGGGIIVKTLNGLAAARPTVATHSGNSGTGAQPGRDLLVVDQEPEAFSEAVVRLLQDRELWEQMAVNGRRYVAENFDWELTRDVLEHLVGR